MLKSIAVVAGSYILSIVLVLATDPLLSHLFPGDFVRGRVPSNTALMTSTALFVVISIFCAWLCARFAPSRSVRHVLWFFAIGEVMGIAATIPNWSKGWPHWYWLSWLLTWPVSCWIGFLLSYRRAGKVSVATANEVYAIRNPLDKVTIPASEEEHDEIRVILPAEVMTLVERLPLLVKVAVLLVAATGVRISECLGLRWRHVRWDESKILIEQTFRRGEVQRRTKTKTSKGAVPMCDLLSACLAEWRRQSSYSAEEDFIFASPTLNGMKPLWGQTINADYLKPAAVALGLVAQGSRFGWHRLRHSISTWVTRTPGTSASRKPCCVTAIPK